MTKVHYYPKTLDLIVKGHAGQAEKGEDLVCAACSTLANTLEAVFQVQKDMHGVVVRNEKTAQFHAFIHRNECQLMAQAFVVMETIATGYAALAEQFPDYVEFEVITEEGEGE